MNDDINPASDTNRARVLLESWRMASRLAVEEARTFWTRIAIIAAVNVVLLLVVAFLLHGGLSNPALHAFSIRRLSALLGLSIAGTVLAWFVALAVRRSIGYQRFYAAKARETEQQLRNATSGDHPRVFTDAEGMGEVAVRVMERYHARQGVSSFAIASTSTVIVAMVWSSLSLVYVSALVTRTMGH